MRRYLPFFIIGGVLLAAIIAGLILYRYRMEPEAPPPVSTPSPSPIATAAPSVTAAASPVATVTPATAATPIAPTAGPVFHYGRPGAEPVHLRGNYPAPVVLEEFGDFQCLPCSLLWSVLEKLEHDYGPRLAVVFREHPLRIHRSARDAARAAEAAGLQGKFWEMHDALYRNRETWIPATYIGPYFNEYAAQIGLDLDRFKADLEGEEVARRLAADWDRGDSLGIDRTPVIYLNGEKVPVTEHNEKGMRAAIDRILAANPQPESSP